MGRGRQSRQKVADRVRRQARLERYREETGRDFAPKNPRSPSSWFSHMGESMSMGLVDGMEYAMRRRVATEIRQLRADARPLWKIAIAERLIRAKAYDERKKNDIRNRMRDRAELKSYMFEDQWGDEISGVSIRASWLNELAGIDRGDDEASEER